jgi:hypothetical protein
MPLKTNRLNFEIKKAVKMTNVIFSQKLALFILLYVFLAPSVGSIAGDIVARPAEPGQRLHAIKAIEEEIVYERSSIEGVLELGLQPYEWKQITKRDGRRRWRINMHSSRPIDLYFVYPGHDVGNPPDMTAVRSASRKKWLNIRDIEEDTFLPWQHEYGVGRIWSFYLFNRGTESSRVFLSVDTSGKATEQEKKYHGLMFLIVIFLTGGIFVGTYRLIRWRLKNPI